MSDIDEGLQAIHKVLKDIRKCNREILALLSAAKEKVLEGDEDDDYDDEDDDDDGDEEETGEEDGGDKA